MQCRPVILVKNVLLMVIVGNYFSLVGATLPLGSTQPCQPLLFVEFRKNSMKIVTLSKSCRLDNKVHRITRSPRLEPGGSGTWWSVINWLMKKAMKFVIARSQESPPDVREILRIKGSTRLSDDALDALQASLTVSESEEFLTKDFKDLSPALQKKILASPLLCAREELIVRFQDDVHFLQLSPCSYYYPPDPLASLYYTVHKLYNANQHTTSISLKPQALVVVEDMMDSISAQSVSQAALVWSRTSQTRNRPIPEKEFFLLPCFDWRTAALRAEFIKLISRSHDNPATVPCIISREALVLRLELLQQFYLYQYPEFLECIEHFPEYEASMCALAERINRDKNFAVALGCSATPCHPYHVAGYCIQRAQDCLARKQKSGISWQTINQVIHPFQAFKQG